MNFSKWTRRKVLFNASVVLAGIKSPAGASGVLLDMAGKRQVAGVVSELILSEVMRHVGKLGLSGNEVEKKVLETFAYIMQAPQVKIVDKYLGKVIDDGDAHILASAEAEECEVLVTLDKKHLLVLAGKISGLEILSPGQLLQRLKTK